MFKRLSKAMQYSPRGKFRRPFKPRMGWMFPLLAVVSLFMNGSVHFRRSRGVSAIEKGPPATSVPMEGQQRNEFKPAQQKSKLVEAIRRQIEEPTTNSLKAKPKLTEALSRGQEKSTKLVPQEKSSGFTADKERKLDTADKSQRKLDTDAATIAKLAADVAAGPAAPIPSKKKKKKKKAKMYIKKTKKKKIARRAKAKTAVQKTVKADIIDPAIADAVVPTKRRVMVSPAALSPNVTFSACLLVRDDNDIISEWIAYHYHVLRMRRLIVAVDPNSETSPSDLLDDWRGLINITLWTDDQYMPIDFLETGKPPKKEIKEITKFGDISESENIAINNHRYRQRVFLGKCLRKVKQENRTWAAHIDTDEYIVPNQLLREFDDKSVVIKPVEEPGSVLDLVQQLVKTNPSALAYPCITMLRVLFGSVESTGEERTKTMPEGYNRDSFETMRWLHHASPFNKKVHGHPKVLIDVSKISSKYLKDDIVYSIHRPFKALCRGHGISNYKHFEKYPISANHYLGSWERYNARNDARRSWSVYNEKATVRNGQDNWVEGWLDGFINDVGSKQADRLLGQRYVESDKSTTKQE